MKPVPRAVGRRSTGAGQCEQSVQRDEDVWKTARVAGIVHGQIQKSTVCSQRIGIRAAGEAGGENGDHRDYH